MQLINCLIELFAISFDSKIKGKLSSLVTCIIQLNHYLSLFDGPFLVTLSFLCPMVVYLLQLERQEYCTDDDENGNVAEEDEHLAEKLKHALGDHVIDDLEISDKYKAPADLLHDNERPSKEQLDTAAVVIRRCVEYGEKYEKENENEDKHVVLVEESSDESEVWDCETIVSTYSNIDNHPGKIGAPETTRKKKLAETLFGPSSATSHVISLRGKEKLPVDFLPHSIKPVVEKVKDVDSKMAEQQKRKQHGQESKEEKKERKVSTCCLFQLITFLEQSVSSTIELSCHLLLIED